MHARTRTHGCNRLRARMLQVQQAQTSPAGAAGANQPSPALPAIACSLVHFPLLIPTGCPLW